MKTFEEFLEKLFSMGCYKVLEDMDAEEIIFYANQYGKQCYEEGKGENLSDSVS